MTAIIKHTKSGISRLWRVRPGYGTLPYVQYAECGDPTSAKLVMVISSEHGPIRVPLADGQCRALLKHLIDVLGKERGRVKK